MHKNTVPTDVTEATAVEPDFVVLGSVDVERGPIADLAVSTDGTTIVATHYGDGSVSIIDAYAMTVEADIEMPVEPHMVAAGERRAYVTISGHNYDSVAVIDTENKRVIANHPVAGIATDVAVSPDGTRIFVGQAGEDVVGLAVINTFGRTTPSTSPTASAARWTRCGSAPTAGSSTSAPPTLTAASCSWSTPPRGA